MNDPQLALFRLLVALLYNHDATDALNYFAQPSYANAANVPFSNDQWIKQLVKMENNTLAQIQIALSTYSTGLSNLGLKETPPILPNATEAEKGLCGLQRMRSPGGFV